MWAIWYLTQKWAYSASIVSLSEVQDQPRFFLNVPNAGWAAPMFSSVSRHPISPLALNLGHLTRSRLRTGQGVVTFVGLTAAQQFFISSGGAG